MSSSGQSQIRTHMFARVLGPYFTIVPTMVGVREAYMRALFTEFKANPMWPWLYGAILLMLGLVIIAFHQYWRSPAAVIVSVVGWFLAIRGVILLVVPQAYTSIGNAVEGGSGGQALVRVLAICLALAGLYLTYVGWIAKPSRPESAEGEPGRGACMPRVIKHRDIRRADLLDRASRLFVQHGYDNVSLNDLIADTGVCAGKSMWRPASSIL